MKVTAKAASIDITVTTDAGEVIYHHGAENIDIALNTDALLDGVKELVHGIGDAVRTANVALDL